MKSVDGVELAVGMTVYSLWWNCPKKAFRIESHIVKEVGPSDTRLPKTAVIYEQKDSHGYKGARYSSVYGKLPRVPTIFDDFKTWLTVKEYYNPEVESGQIPSEWVK